jgi:hypothetical protein
MRNAPSSITALPHVHNLTDLERAFNARRRELRIETQAATLAGRVLAMFRRSISQPRVSGPLVAPPLAQPSMSWVDGPRTQPRDGRGRFLPRTWLADAELFLPADRAWFRSPITEGK